MRLASSAARSRSLAAIFSIAGPVIRDTGPPPVAKNHPSAQQNHTTSGPGVRRGW